MFYQLVGLLGKYFLSLGMRFRRIEGFETLYHISEDGRVLSLGNGDSTDSRTKELRILKQRIKPNGYKQVKLCKKGLPYHKLVHRLVAIAFIENPENLREVNHKDGNKENNHYSNLEWISSSDNQKHAFKLGLQKSVKGKDHKQSHAVLQLNLDGSFVKEWGSIREIQREMGFNRFGITNCCKNKNKYKTAYGFKWQYKNLTGSDIQPL